MAASSRATLGGARVAVRALPSLPGLLQRLHLTVTGAAAALLIVLGWALARLLSSKGMYLMAYGGVLTLGISWLVSRTRLGVNAARSELPLRMQAGQAAEVELSLQCRRRLSTVVLNEALPASFGTNVTVPLSSLRPGDEFQHRYTFVPPHRGVYDIGPLTARWSDPFGVTTHQQVLLDATEVIVHPRGEPVSARVLTRMWEDPPVRPPVSKPWPVGFEFYGLRDYVPGDDLRRVVWQTLAKTGQLMVRESEQGITDRVVLVVDTQRSQHSPGDPSESLECAVRLAASVGAQHLHEGFSVTLVTNQGLVLSQLRGAHARIALLDELARLQPSDRPLRDAGQDLLDVARGGAHVLVAVPSLDDPTAVRLRLMIDRGAIVVVAQIAWEESDPATLSRAAALGCQVLQVPVDSSLGAVFATGARR
jgi:uncharacterized protein (DUF58 family)